MKIVQDIIFRFIYGIDEAQKTFSLLLSFKDQNLLSNLFSFLSHAKRNLMLEILIGKLDHERCEIQKNSEGNFEMSDFGAIPRDSSADYVMKISRDNLEESTANNPELISTENSGIRVTLCQGMLRIEEGEFQDRNLLEGKVTIIDSIDQFNTSYISKR